MLIVRILLNTVLLVRNYRNVRLIMGALFLFALFLLSNWLRVVFHLLFLVVLVLLLLYLYI